MDKKYRFYLLVSAITIFLITLSGAYSGLRADAPIHIEADRMSSSQKSNSVVFTGAVSAKQGDITIRSDKMTVHYSEQKGKKNQKNPTQQVEKLICVGNVEVTRAEWLGTSKKMVYLSNKRQVILTGNAKAWQDQNMVSGEKIIYYLDEGRSEVIGKTNTVVGDSKKKKGSRVNMTILQN